MVQKCNPGEGFCHQDSDCSSGPDGIGQCQAGTCDTSICSGNTGKCFAPQDKCCIRVAEGYWEMKAVYLLRKLLKSKFEYCFDSILREVYLIKKSNS